MSRCSSSRSLIWCQINVWQHFSKAGGQDLCRFSEKTCCHDLFTAAVIANTRQVEHVDLLWEMDPVTSVVEREWGNRQEVKNSGEENNVPVNARHNLHPTDAPELVMKTNCDRHDILHASEGPGLIFFTLTLNRRWWCKNKPIPLISSFCCFPPSYQCRDRSEGKLGRYTDVWWRTRKRHARFPPCWQLVGLCVARVSVCT